MTTGLWKVPSCGKPRSKARAFPHLLENADEAGVSHTSHSPCCYKQAVDIVQQPVLDVSGFCPRCPSQYTRSARGRRALVGLNLARVSIERPSPLVRGEKVPNADEGFVQPA